MNLQVFVYGTLMRGEHHHDVLAGAEFVHVANTEPLYDLFRIDYYPALVHGGSTTVRGEVYRVGEAMLARLDELEEAPGYYEREWITLASGLRVQTYVMPRERLHDASPIPSGDFRKQGG